MFIVCLFIFLYYYNRKLLNCNGANDPINIIVSILTDLLDFEESNKCIGLNCVVGGALVLYANRLVPPLRIVFHI